MQVRQVQEEASNVEFTAKLFRVLLRNNHFCYSNRNEQ